MKRRSDFEHKLNARGSKPVDYARYAEYEMNLESLRRKRVKRIGLKNTGHTGQRRIFFILDRATRKFSGDLGLWMQYIDFARKQKANKKLSRILTTVLRLHPTKAELWIYAAHYALDERSDIVEARNSMQRGLRFCKNSKHLWCEYTKLEMIYISRISARGRFFQQHDSGDESIIYPSLDTEENDSETFDHIDEGVLEELQKTPALSGAIPIAIFNAAMKQFPQDSDIGKQLFDVIAQFQETPCVSRVLRHIVQSLRDAAPQNLSTMICFFKEPISCVKPVSAHFPTALRESLSRLKISLETKSTSSSRESNAQRRCVLACEVVNWILDLLESQENELDQDISKALMGILKKTCMYTSERILFLMHGCLTYGSCFTSRNNSYIFGEI